MTDRSATLPDRLEPPPALWGREHLDAVLETMVLQLVPEVEI